MTGKQATFNLKKRWRLFLPLLVCLFFSLTLLFSLDKDPHDLNLVQQNKPFPIFSAQDLLNPEQVITNQDFNGKIILLNVWASWCATCRAEAPFLLQLSKQPGLSLYGLNYRDDQQKALNLLQNESNPYTHVIFDPEGKLALTIGVYGTPETYLIDDKGIIRLRYSGELNEQRWQAIFAPEIAAIIKNRGHGS